MYSPWVPQAAPARGVAEVGLLQAPSYRQGCTFPRGNLLSSSPLCNAPEVTEVTVTAGIPPAPIQLRSPRGCALLQQVGGHSNPMGSYHPMGLHSPIFNFFSGFFAIRKESCSPLLFPRQRCDSGSVMAPR